MPDSKASLALDAARNSLGAFCRYAYRRFQQPRHIAYIIEQLERLERGEIDRLMVECPPRHGKTWLCSWFLPSWWLGRHPDQSIIHVSYGDALARDFGMRVRNLLVDGRYARVFPRTALRSDSQAAHRFALMAGGNYYAVGYGGPVTGRGADLLIIDDAVKSMAEANSEASRATLRSYWESVLSTRLEPNAKVLMIGTRWHQADLLGMLQAESEDEWTVVRLPAVSEGAGDPLGRPEGHALWPERFNAAALAKKRRQVGSIAWLAEYQQRPSAIEGSIFKRSWWGSYDEPPDKLDVVFSGDTAFKTGRGNDFSVILVIGITRQQNYYVLDMLRGRYEFPELIRKAEALAERWPRVECFLVEDRASGQSLVQALRHSAGNHFSVIPVQVDADKQSRAIATTRVVEGSRVFLPRNARWLNDFLDELSSFPSAPHDDITDAFSQAINYLEQNAGWNFMGTGYPNGPAKELIDYRSILNEHWGNYAVAARALGLTVEEFQARLYRSEREANAMIDEYDEGVAEWDRVLGGSGNSAPAAVPSWYVRGAPMGVPFTIGWPRR